MIMVADCARVPLQDKCVDLVFGSTLYMDARLYLENGKDLGVARDCAEWVSWMLDVVTELRRVCRGPVIINAAGVTRDRNYWPGCEGLMWEWWKRGGDCQLYRPCFFHRVGIPGSGGIDWFRSDTEFVMCFKGPGPLPWADNTSMGHPPKWVTGGEMSNRMANGSRINQAKPWGEGGFMPETKDGDVVRRKTKLQTRRKANGERPGRKVQTIPRDGMHNQEQDYTEPAIANPGNLISLKVGGGLMGSNLAHLNEAPFPEGLPEFFVRSCCPPNGIVYDPWSGSGTTAAVAKKHGRRYVAGDLRMSQALLTRTRLNGTTAGMFA